MPTVIDANVLIALFTKDREDKRDARIRGLIKDTRSSRGRLIIPSPALAEFSVGATDAELDFLNSQSIFKIAPFDAVTALECGFLIRDVFAKDGKKNRQKIKFDLQILAIAKAQGAQRLVTNDEQLRKRAIQFGIQGVDLSDLPIPDDERQMPLALKDAHETRED
ncbi:Putative nucleic acid-binding protein, PIN domain-containing [Methyloversatilis universalis FAM5]|uniref:Ribonuclease VapC n=1 Tax=Methyloversatilis universalis (strain ATCC BAA-1314 / DSM 25237 / JCM 13912 / CCUG 52030 / FAM5) TaxID=1000565 RepID=F5RBS0_METUF|nr:type II toxin-antitoxin system VapC family toxin [Methyloversatilis universalis]EGK71937.1 Putative nucleic acid-binding protein, PIN domain-containing [Methyloversatilis universalis FAM5]